MPESPDAKLTLTFPVRILPCYGDETRTVKNVVSARQTDGTRIEARMVDVFTFRDGKIAVKNAFRKDRPPVATASR